MIRKFLFLLLAVCLPMASAIAADLPAKARVASPVAPWSWSGMDIGLEGGMNLGRFSPFCSAAICGPTGTEVNLDDNNWFIGGHLGYLYQTGNLVIGPEIGVQYWGFKAKADLAPSLVLTPTLQTKVDWLAYANVRAGIAITPGVLVYLTGGPAWAHIKGDAINIATIDLSNEQSAFGLNIGGGVAFKLTEYLSFGGEYRHYDFGKVTAANPILSTAGIGNSDRLTVDQAMARLSYRLAP